MITHRWSRVWLVMLTTLSMVGLLLPLTVTAQAVSQVVINYVQADDLPDKFAVDLKVFFTLQDSSKKAISGAQVDKATFVLDPEDGGSYDAKVGKANGPISLVLVLDTSNRTFNQ